MSLDSNNKDNQFYKFCSQIIKNGVDLSKAYSNGHKKRLSTIFDIQDFMEDLEVVLGREFLQQFWLTIYYLRTELENYKTKIIDEIKFQQIRENKIIQSFGMAINWELSDIFKTIFIEYLFKSEICKDYTDYLENGLIVLYIDNRFNSSIDNWYEQNDLFCTLGLTSGNSSSSSKRMKYEIVIPITNNYLKQPICDTIKLLVNSYFTKRIKTKSKELIKEIEKLIKISDTDNFDNLVEKGYNINQILDILITKYDKKNLTIQNYFESLI